MTNQIHVSNGTRIQTLAAIETAGGVTLLSIGGGFGDATLHIPFAARAWLSGVAESEWTLADVKVSKGARQVGVGGRRRALVRPDPSRVSFVAPR